ncbi:dTDP-4-dehydrorhamnose reductase [Candidatus Kinetoplastibacterium desouzaii TCC079E]|uniref:dTDP-4-dehydrorhamnose reductase n=1 Tax=Candidatus Kinetoplastidibacterium desouzai TCC079E TaxID=1208919 RepID=M1LLT8_9PROT|nr:dTDP-4-dehydrorhamnose reductase [Candidatus Kinetoplastibacterium desouzaii]AGF46707.1 dTDP-4-dehydrorhamnose reductase [Candidatus Kinetoplastibacterium desouzaii TCC079E]
MKILLIGQKGQLGQKIYKQLTEIKYISLICWDRQTIDLLYTESVFYKLLTIKPDIIINSAAYTNVDQAEKNIELTFRINYILIKTLVKYSLLTKSLLVQFSTDYVFDGKKNQPYTETDPTNPLNIYGHSKLASDLYILQKNCNSLIFRISWLFSSQGNNFLLKILDQAQYKQTLRITSDQYGSPLSANEVASISTKLILELYKHKKNGAHLYHISINNIMSRYSLAKSFLTKIKNESKTIKIKCNKIIPIKYLNYDDKTQRPRNSALKANEIIQKHCFLPNINKCIYETIEEIKIKQQDKNDY